MDLNAPLGLDGPPGQNAPGKDTPGQDTPAEPRRRRWVVPTVAGLLAAGAVAALGAVLVTADPRGGEPYGVAAIAPAAPKPARPAVPVKPAADPSPAGTLPPQPRMTVLAPPGGMPQPGPGQAAGPLVIDVAKVLAERGRQGGDDPTATLVTPLAPASRVDGSPPRREAAVAAAPKIAIVVAGMGLGATATRTATEIMPPAVTFAFVPYGETIGAAVAAAKSKGHEILLQMPMQDAGAPPPGPHALRAGEPAQEVAADAAWAFGRLKGYAGVSNFLGGPVTSDKPVMEALLRAVASRNLYYVDDGTSRRSLGPVLAQSQGLATARADVVLDATADPAAVRANLEALAELAKRKGTAIGLASGLPEHMAAIAGFASGLGARDIALVPVGALVARTSSVAVAQ